MPEFRERFEDRAFVDNYVTNGPPAFMPGHAGVLQMAGLLLREHAPEDAHVLVVGAGGGLDTRALALQQTSFRFFGVDPAPQMLELARQVVGAELSARVDWLEGTIDDVAPGPFDAATCILVIGLLPDDGAKLDLLRGIHARLARGAPFVLVDQCFDRSAPDFERTLDRYAAYARTSGVDPESVEQAKAALRTNPGLVAPERDEALMREAGFRELEAFYVGMAWRGWCALA